MKIWSKINYITKSLQIVFKITQITIRERGREREREREILYVGDKFINILLYNFAKFEVSYFNFLATI